MNLRLCPLGDILFFITTMRVMMAAQAQIAIRVQRWIHAEFVRMRLI